MRLKILRQQDLTDRIAVVVGTRPGIIKMAPIIRELRSRGDDYLVIHTGQHYSHQMDRALFLDLELPYPTHHLKTPRHCRFHGEQTAEMLKGVEQILLDARPKVVLVCGDANTNLAAGLAARKLRIVVGHVEAGLRSYDWSMPEEHNRVILDHISELLFAPTPRAARCLYDDGVRGKVYVTGNTIVDAVRQNVEIARRKSRVLGQLQLQPQGYVLCTIHREENVDVEERLESLLRGVESASRELGAPTVFPVHPRTKQHLEKMRRPLDASDILRPIDPLGYLDFLALLADARLVLTDSGGVQEESCVLRVPCVTLRDNTERPETLEVGANLLAGVRPRRIVAAAKTMLSRSRHWSNPFGDGTAAHRIVQASREALTASTPPLSGDSDPSDGDRGRGPNDWPVKGSTALRPEDR